MAKTSQKTTAVTVSGDGLGTSNTPTYSRTSTVNSNAPGPETLTTVNGSITVNVPSGLTVNGMTLAPPVGSVNSKTLKGASGDTGFPNWTSQSIDIPVTAGQQFVITSSAVGEEIDIYFW